MTDHELQKTARECYDKVFYNNCNKPDYIPHATIIANYLKQVRDAQEEKLKVAKNSLGYAKYHLENGRVSSAIYFVDEALERMGGE